VYRLRITERSAATVPPPSTVRFALRDTVTPRTPRVLDLDIENRPLSYWYDDRCTAEITAIAAGWTDEQKVHVWLLGQDAPEAMLSGLSSLYEQANMVTAHNVRRHDLPIIQGALAEYGLPLLGPKMASDTLRDIPRWKDLPKSQESLCEMLDVPAPKEHMSQSRWREANRLTPRGTRETKRRVVGDVIQHRLLREKLIELGWLGPPRRWNG
jgi:hypothetical protein